MEDNKESKNLDVKSKVENFPVADYAEALLDFCAESELVKAIPVFSTGVGMFKAYSQYKEGKFKRKVQSFVEAVGDMSPEDWSKFEASLEAEGKKEQFLNELLEIIEKADSEQKAKILGGIFRRLVKTEIEHNIFEDQVRITNEIRLLKIFDFMHGYHNPYILEESLGDVLVSFRMATRKIELAEKTVNLLAGTKVQYIKTSYDITAIGGAYLITLHQVHKEKIDADFLYTGGPIKKSTSF
ncbi:hypothetical protein JFT60_21845 [Pseudomonas sp. MF6772]|uniref:hypothetical protein n=1 Tax=Pseudomonas sp. MF6772 TaxID=2797533 RepID=UPI0018E7C91C|nr:hypothetical protein [Pseudomonas sp. MF6772]MBJ2270036.1 hypothetical protein [Pseudomonas sp. MF6772]